MKQRLYIYSFEKLRVWQESKEFAKQIYFLTSKFPHIESFGISTQMRRAAISICSNLAEGTARRTKRDKAHFITLSFSSAMELINQLIIARELNYIDETTYFGFREDLASITNKLNALRNSQLGSR